MRTATRLGLAGSLVLPLMLSAVLACDKKPTGDTAAATSSDPASSAASSSDPTFPKVSYTKKPAGKGTHAVTQTAKRGGSGATAPNANSPRTPEPSTDRQMRKRARVDLADCKTLPDNAAECDGNNFYFCDDSRLWVVDCDAEAKFSGVASGSCFEGEKFTDCLGCDTADDGSTVCCDFKMTVCCTGTGDACWSPQ